MTFFQKVNQRVKSVFGMSGVGGFTWGWANPLSEWSKTQQLREYTRYVHTIVSAIAQDVAMVELTVKDKNGKRIEKHPIIDLLKRPNPMSSQFQFIEMHITYMKLVGESFWYLTFPNQVSNKPDGIYLLRPDMVDVVIGDDEVGSVEGYVLNKSDGTKIPLDTNEIIHHKLPNPLNPYRGMGIVEAARTYIQTEEFSSEWTKNSLYNSGRPSGIVTLKGTINKEEFSALKKRFKQEYSGTNNAGKTMFIKASDGLEYQKLGMELGEVAIKELKDMTKEDIMMMFRVSKTMLGMSNDVNLSNAREAKIVWQENIIQPDVWRLIDQLDVDLSPRYGGIHLDFQSEVEADHEKARADFNAGLMTLNEARVYIGLSELPNGDIRYMPMNMTPQPEDPMSEIQDEPIEEEKSFREYTVEQKEGFRKDVFIRQEAWEKKYILGLKSIFDSQKKEILGKNKKAFSEWKFDPIKSKNNYFNILIPITESMVKEQGDSALKFAGDPDTEFVITPQLEKYIKDRIDAFATDVDTATLKKIEEVITDGVMKGDSVTKLRKRILEVYVQLSTVSAERIARTETIAASNEAALEAYKQSPLVTQKEWLAEPDACSFCQGLNGEVLGLDTDYAKVGESLQGKDGETLEVTYADIDAPPVHPNCRCTILPVASFTLSIERIQRMEKNYADMDKRTKEARKLLDDISTERAKLEDDKQELDEVLKELEETL